MKKHQKILNIIPGLFIIGLMGYQAFAVPPPELAETGADKNYMKGMKALHAGADKEAAGLLIKAAREDRRCLLLLEEEIRASKSSIKICSDLEPVDELLAGDPAAEVLYRLAAFRKNSARSQAGEATARKAGQYFLSRATEEFRGSPWADAAELSLIEDGFCLDGAGFPDCTAWEIRGYEQWLKGHSASSQKPPVLKSLAGKYLALAGKFEEDKPWKNAIRGEICRGRALEIAKVIVKGHPGTEYAKWAKDFIRGIEDSEKPYSMVPETAVSWRAK